MSHSANPIIMIATCLSFALFFGFITQKLKMSPIVGYLLAGIVVGPFSPGFVADTRTASQLAEVGVILLMFGVGLQFHFKDLMAVKNIAIKGALVQIITATFTGALIMHFLGYSPEAGLVFGIAISVASTVVLTRVLTDNHSLHTPTGHTAIGWLVVEDLFTILVLVLLPSVFSQTSNTPILQTLSLTVLKLVLLVGLVLILGQKILPAILNFVAKTGTRDLFTLAVLVLALGIAVGASEFFGASMALGAFLAGMVIGQSDFSARAASEALPMRDAFAVLFFVSVGMLFDPSAVISNWKLIAVTLFIVIIIKPLSAIFVVLALKQSVKKAVFVGVALSQIGEFSFILVSLGITLGILNNDIYNAVIATAIISIILNPLFYKLADNVMKFFRTLKIKNIAKEEIFCDDEECIILIGFGPVGRKIAPIILSAGVNVCVIEMNIETVCEINSKKEKGLCTIHGDATQKEVLLQAGIECAKALVVSAATAPAAEIMEVARAIQPNIRILIHTAYLKDAKTLKHKGANVVFSGEGEVVRSLSSFILKEFGSCSEEIDWKCKKLDKER